jgi:hypothetical protein
MAARRFKSRLFRASDGVQSFWRWEVYISSRRSPLESGVLYGTETRSKTSSRACNLTPPAEGKDCEVRPTVGVFVLKRSPAEAGPNYPDPF